MPTIPIDEFVKTHRCDADWIKAVKANGGKVIALVKGQEGTTSGVPATVQSHYCNGMYEVRVSGGLKCISATDFVPN
ncbi:hypothetical protein [Hydrogenophaga sp. OTU3427]|uniref:hypothetical protein n=1 Tax=Hydrogenophaga sp. OTU3427 TaxID=3043856 RepID=UPI00313D9B9C